MSTTKEQIHEVHAELRQLAEKQQELRVKLDELRRQLVEEETKHKVGDEVTWRPRSYVNETSRGRVTGFGARGLIVRRFRKDGSDGAEVVVAEYQTQPPA